MKPTDLPLTLNTFIMLKTMRQLLFLSLAFTLVTACKKDTEDPVPPTPPPAGNEQELITTLILTFTDAENPSETFELRWSDPDGDGGNDPVITGDILPQNRAYSMAVRVLDESGSSPVELTNEIAAEKEEHQFFFLPSNVNLTFFYADQDANGNPVGLANTAIAGGPSLGSLTVILRHEPNKAGAGVAAGDPTNAGGDTDIEVTLPVRVD